MGEISQKLRAEFIKAKASKVIDFRALAEGKKVAEERQKDNAAIAADLQGQDPLLLAHSSLVNFLGDMAYDLSAMPQMAPFYDIIEKGADEYWPSAPPNSPVTKSYWNYWMYFDLKYGRDKETIAGCLLDLADLLPYPEWFVPLLKQSAETRMGIYEHLGIIDGKIGLKELVTNKVYAVIAPAGYEGHKGELWYVRIFPYPQIGYDLVGTTPYVLIIHSRKDWLDFFARQGIERGDPEVEQKMSEFMKFGPKKKRFYWHEFVMDGYANHEPSHIYLTGLPDCPESLPHNKKSKITCSKFFPKENHAGLQ